MIKTLTIHHFKSIRDLTLSCRGVNVLIGEPNSGKTNILEALGLLCPKVTRHAGRVLRVTLPVDLFWDQNLTNSIIVEVDESEISIKGSQDGLTANYREGRESDPRTGYFQLDGGLNLSNLNSKLPKQVIRYYLFDALVALDGQENTFLEAPFGQNMTSLLYASKEARQSSAKFFQNSGFRLNVDFTHRRLLVTKEVDDTLISFPYNSASETLRRMVFYHLAIETGGGQILIFDEPEAHSFPPFTKNLAERMALDDRGTQFFLTTHSPYMLDSLLAKTPADNLNIVLCRMENFETKTYPLNDAQKAKLMEWSMDSFFNFDRLLEEA